MRTVKDVYNVCQKTVNRLDKKEITSRFDIAFKLPLNLVVNASKNVLGVTIKELESEINTPLLIIKTTFTKQHGLKHCVVKLNPRLKDLGLRFDTSLEDACLFVKCLHKQDEKVYYANELKEYNYRKAKTLKNMAEIDVFIDENTSKIQDVDLQNSLQEVYKECL